MFWGMHVRGRISAAGPPLPPYPTGWAAWAYTGVTTPLVPDALAVCERSGFRRIVVQPYFLFTGVLLKRIYRQVEERRRARPELEFVATPHLQAHSLLVEAFLDRAEEAFHGLGHMNCSLCQYRVPIIGHEHKVGELQHAHHHHVQGLHHHVHHLDEHVSATPDLSSQREGEFHAWTGELLRQLEF